MRKFCIDVGVANGFLDKVKEIGSDKAVKILNTYPEISPLWLLTGEGEMLLENREETSKTHESSTDLREIIALLEEKADRIERENISLRNEIESLK